MFMTLLLLCVPGAFGATLLGSPAVAGEMVPSITAQADQNILIVGGPNELFIATPTGYVSVSDDSTHPPSTHHIGVTTTGAAFYNGVLYYCNTSHGAPTDATAMDCFSRDPFLGPKLRVAAAADFGARTRSSCIACAHVSTSQQPQQFYSVVSCPHCKWSHCVNCRALHCDWPRSSKVGLCYPCFLDGIPVEDRRRHLFPASPRHIASMSTPHCVCSGCETMLQRSTGCNQLLCPVCSLTTCSFCNLTDYDVEYHVCGSNTYGCARTMDHLDVGYKCEEAACHGDYQAGPNTFFWECTDPSHKPGRDRLLAKIKAKMTASLGPVLNSKDGPPHHEGGGAVRTARPRGAPPAQRR